MKREIIKINPNSMSRPVVIITHPRSGGTYLTHCLSSHPQISADRGEVLHAARLERYEIPGIIDSVLLKLALEKQGYAVGLAKLIYDHVSDDAWRYLVENDVALIHLYRENVLRVAVSYYLTQYVPDYQIHSYAPSTPPRVSIVPDVLIAMSAAMQHAQLQWCERLSECGLRVLTLTYTQITGREEHEAAFIPRLMAQSICAFLAVDHIPLISYTRRTTNAPLATIIENWSEVKPAIAVTEFAYCLEDEENYERLIFDDDDRIN